MKTWSFLQPAAVQTPFQHDIWRTWITAVMMLMFLNSCNTFQNDTDSFLDKQIERQQAQHEFLSESAPQEKKTVAEYEELGDRYLIADDINRAYIYYLKGLELEPDNLSLNYKQGALLLKKGKFGEAAKVYQKLLDKNSKDPIALEGSGKAFFGQGKFEQAEKLFLAALENNPAQWQSQEFLGLISSRYRKYDHAIEWFKKALSSKPNDISVNNNLAVTYYIMGNFKEAIRVFQKLSRKTNDRKIHNNLALAYFQLGQYKKAMESFEKGSENVAVAYNNMGCQYLTKRKFNEAIQAFEKAIEFSPKYYPTAQKNLDIAKYELSTVEKESEN